MSAPFAIPRIEECPKRVQVFFGGECIIDSKKAKLVWEHPYYPAHFFSLDELPKKFLANKQGTEKVVYDVVVGSRRALSAVTSYSPKTKDFGGLFTVKFGAMDSWFEEEEQLFVHCKDPYKRVDVLQSSRHVRVEVKGVEVANTHMPRLLYETGLRVRTYIPKTHCRLDLLEPSKHTTECPYKGEAEYYNVRTGPNELQENIVWWYRNPMSECAVIRGYVAFYDEKVDVWVDGEKQV
ncbi:DUF427-domain-containing protein [Tricholoma matsutake]|nr:DUF427-domain-containing protein [Tricholoma matsutake 945]